ncbi:MAG: hypothetical protein OYK82_07230 [Gammaproteobacteria bacterium]|nr:hypothetical protein [Gammaproteobacteria bacterium]
MRLVAVMSTSAVKPSFGTSEGDDRELDESLEVVPEALPEYAVTDTRPRRSRGLAKPALL